MRDGHKVYKTNIDDAYREYFDYMNHNGGFIDSPEQFRVQLLEHGVYIEDTEDGSFVYDDRPLDGRKC